MNGSDKNRISVDIFGTQYKLMGTTSVSYLKMVASYVNDQMHRIAETNGRLDTPRIAVLAAVNMADEYFRLKSDLDRAVEEYHKVKNDADGIREMKEEQGRLKEESRKWEEACNSLEFQVRELQLRLQETAVKDRQKDEELQKLQEEAPLREAQLREELRELEQRNEVLEQEWQNRLIELESQWRKRLEEKEKDWKEYADGLAERNDVMNRELVSMQEAAAGSLAEDRSLQADYDTLKDEYEKLKKEYNEWLELVLDKE